MSTPKPIVTENLPGINCKRLKYSEVLKALSIDTQSASETTTDIHTTTNASPLTSCLIQAKSLQESTLTPQANATLQRTVRTAGKIFVGANDNFNAPVRTGSGVLVSKNLLLTTGHVCSWAESGCVAYPVEQPRNPLGNYYMMVEQPVRIVDVDDEGDDGKELESDMYSLGGWLGGPLWGAIEFDIRVVGVMSGDEADFSQPRHTVSAGGVAMVLLVQYGLAHWPV
ncbi:hypothetical protein B0T16DRAFT_391779 [Cercophora newfieldiana]|uniref:Serine protease n=1 Tax=Cercophora newfieldiana TaxID=92897 RepID=A0AA39Y2A9_9PEZI|nr:hypothetical protein B0T16DRAFT_391779 [Cercophora newfieldiana]